MAVKEIKKGILSVGAIDWDRRLFDELIPLPDGTSYNAYIVLGSEKTALIDTVDPTKEKELLRNLKEAGIEKIDYVIANHAEQDHSGAIPTILEKYPGAKVVTNAKCKAFLMDLLHVPEEKFIVIEEGESLSLGDRTLEFYMTPWVHWPETMVTYLREDKILFTCDFFGSHFASSELYANEDARVLEDAKRYYAEIMMPFRTNIKKNIEKVEKLDIEIIAPSHGTVYRRPSFIIDAYKDWISDRVENKVLVPYVSMHGSTREMVEYFVRTLMKRGMKVKQCNAIDADIGKFAMELVDAATVVLATPTVLAGPHPAIVYAAALTAALRPKTRFLSIIGSYGWGGRTVDTLKSLLTPLKAELIEPVLIKGLPRKEELKKLDELADRILEKHREIGIA
ncbi:MAG: FprA family A-type flavoprotein [Candidatus Hydrothermota bacterium]|nr:MAG: FprA family A-type flavoprotein [Candidatus Hydrothermae bacterium]RKZ04356.1 MAG: FprA family A-type flavoprotein [Candidatus Hydrothermae bacterium]